MKHWKWWKITACGCRTAASDSLTFDPDLVDVIIQIPEAASSYLPSTGGSQASAQEYGLLEACQILLNHEPEGNRLGGIRSEPVVA